MSEEWRAVLGRPEIAKLQAIGKGLKVKEVTGTKLLVKMVKPYTEVDEVTKTTGLIIPKWVDQANRPAPTVGVVIKVGPKVMGSEDNRVYPSPHRNPEVEDHHVIVEEGSAVMCSKYAGCDISLEGEDDFKIIELREVMCTLEVTEEAMIVPEAVA